METKERRGSNFNEEPLSFEEFCKNHNNFFFNFSGSRLPRPKRGNNLTEEEKRWKQNYYAEIAYRRKTGDHKKGEMRNYYFLEKFDKKLADRIKRKYRMYSDLARREIQSNLSKIRTDLYVHNPLNRKERKSLKERWGELSKLGYEAYILLRQHTDDQNIQEALEERKDMKDNDDWKVFFG